MDISGYEVSEGAVASGSPVQIFLRNEGARDVQSVALEFNRKIVSLQTLSAPKLDLKLGGMEVLTLDSCELAYLSAGKLLQDGSYFRLLTGESEDGTKIKFGPRSQKAINTEVEELRMTKFETCKNGRVPLNSFLFPELKKG